MPYVVYFPMTKQYLFRNNARQRKLVDKMDEATTWAKQGHAKLAVRMAMGDARISKVVPAGTAVILKEVFFTSFSYSSYNPHKIRIKK